MLISNEHALLEHEWDFTTMVMPQLLSRFRTRYIWERDNNPNGSRQFYVDPEDPEHNYNPFTLNSDGLTITARKRGLINEGFTTQEYLSGVLSTHQQTGIVPPTSAGTRRLSALLTMPVGTGMWPAWWFNPEFAPGGWPPGIPVLPEIDGLEYLGEGGKYYSVVHSRNGGNVLNQDQYTHNCPDVLLTEPHWFHMERSAETIKFGFDDNWSKEILTPLDLQGPLHMNLNLAVGGTWPESLVGRPTLDSYAFRCERIQMRKINEPDGPIISLPGNPNADIIKRIERLRDEACQCIVKNADDQIVELS